VTFVGTMNVVLVGAACEDDLVASFKSVGGFVGMLAVRVLAVNVVVGADWHCNARQRTRNAC
jgi:hypothetical protein